MGRKKALRIKEAIKLSNVFQKDLAIENKGTWNKFIFRNDLPIVLELGCGKGEYSYELSKLFPEKNFIGVDRKADRIWTGATKAINEKLNNVAFIRSDIESIQQLFAENEISQIWLTFPDPYPKKPTSRLLSPIFLSKYKKILNKNGELFIKTDQYDLYEYTLSVIKQSEFRLLFSTNDLYSSHLGDDKHASIKTNFEKKYLATGSKICFIHFKAS